ncbi:TPR repeat protein [Xylariaceae sp. FL0255]|nr:TPR repeat protein [Xylariaceae sp. FL0255]
MSIRHRPIICALPLEASAVVALFDEHWDENGPPYDRPRGAYTYGTIGRHNVVVAHMPGMGKAHAAAVAVNCRTDFPNIELAIVGGICGAAPFAANGSEIVLGDIIISEGLIQYDLGRRYPERFERKDTLEDSLGRPNTELRALLAKLKSHPTRATLQSKTVEYLKDIRHDPQLEANYPGAEQDRLFESSYRHLDEEQPCDKVGCNGPLVPRARLQQSSQQPAIHFGLLASGDTVMKSGEDRDRLSRKDKVIGFEMEGSGVWDVFPCVQRYSAATAASCLKAFLEFWIPKSPTPVTARPSFNVPFRRDPDFIDRKAIMSKIGQACSAPASRVAIVGLGGVGKSQLAIEHAHRSKREDLWVFWVHAGTQERFDEGFKAIANKINIDARGHSQANVLQLVHDWLQNESNGQWLLILDSADDINMFYNTDQKGKSSKTSAKEERELWTYLPQSSNGSILITTRDKELAFRLTGSHKDTIEVGPMDKEDARALLSIKSGSDFHDQDGTRLVEALECMPLAISQAAAYIHQRLPRMTVRRYLEEFRKSEQKQSSLLKYDNGDLRRDRSASNSVIVTWQVSFESIQSNRPSATKLLSLMSFFDCQGIQEILLRPYKDTEANGNNSDSKSTTSSEDADDGFDEDIATLQNHCLIKISEDIRVFEMHGLVQLATRKWLTASGDAGVFQNQFILRMAQAFPAGDDFENWSICHYRPTDNAAILDWAELLLESSIYCQHQSSCITAGVMTHLSHEALQSTLGPDDPRTLRAMRFLAKAYESLAQYEETAALHSQLLQKQQASLEPCHPDILRSMMNLAWTSQNLFRYEGSESLYEEILETAKTAFEPDAPIILEVMHNMALLYESQGKIEEADKAKLHPNDPDLLTTMLEAAEPLLSQVLERQKARGLGDNNDLALRSMNGLALIFNKQGRLTEAESLSLQAWEKSKMVLGLDHPQTLIYMSTLADTYYKKERWDGAELLQVKVLEKSKMILGLDHPDTLLSMCNLAHTYYQQERWKEAALLDVQVLEKRKMVLGSDHPDTLVAMHNLACTWGKQGRIQDAFRVMEQCVEARTRVLGPEHRHTQDSVSWLQYWQSEDGEQVEVQR